MDLRDKLRKFFSRRRLAYRLVFQKENIHVDAVLKDLARFCRAHETTYHADERIHAVLEGRREVWLRISRHLNLSPDEFWKLNVREVIDNESSTAD